MLQSRLLNFEDAVFHTASSDRATKVLLLARSSDSSESRMVESEFVGQGLGTCCSTASCFEAKRTTQRVASVQVVHPSACWEHLDASRMVAVVHQAKGHRGTDYSLEEELYWHFSGEYED